MANLIDRLKQYQPLWDGWYFSEDDLIGTGASSAVYRAYKYGENGEYSFSAVKIISVDVATEQGGSRELRLRSVQDKRNRAENEISVMYQLNAAPNIVHCRNYGIRDIYGKGSELTGFDILIQMDCYTCLSGYIAQSDCILPVYEVVKLAQQIGSALQYVHKLNYIHRDIKPDNFFMDSDGNYLLGDLGISKQMSEGSFSTYAGTVPYMAPEVWQARHTGGYTKSADIYSLGIVLYTMLNNNYYPFVTPHSTVNEIERAITDRLCGKPLPPPANATPTLSRIILKACMHDPQERYLTIDEFLSDLAQATASDGIAYSQNAAPAVRNEIREVGYQPLGTTVHGAQTISTPKPRSRTGAVLFVIICAVVALACFGLVGGAVMHLFADENVGTAPVLESVQTEYITLGEKQYAVTATIINASSSGITDISALSRCTAVERLDLSNNSIADISALSELKQLRELDISGNPIKDLRPLSELTELTELHIEIDKTTSVAVITHMSSLKKLYITGADKMTIDRLKAALPECRVYSDLSS